MPEIPAQYTLSAAAPSPRTLIEILYETAGRYPDAAAIDDGTVQLTYRELIGDIEASVEWLAARGIGRGDRIGIRMPSGSYALYVAILATLATGAAYVPVDADDPDDRAELVFGEAGVVAIITEAGLIRGPGSSRGWRAAAPLARDDAWIIFTSGSTGTPKGVAVTHRNAAAFVDAEAQMFLRDNPIGPGDRVLAGLSVAFDASCEEMWLAWRHGACLVPAPRSLVRSGMDLGPWLVTRDVTVVSTVPALASLWPAEALEAVRLLIFGGEACPPELAARLASNTEEGGREVWNTYGPTEATVVACAASLTAAARSHRAAAAGLGSGRRRRRRPSGRLWRRGRTGDRRRRAGPLPGRRQGRREIRPDADPGLGTGLSQRRSGSDGTRRAVFLRPQRRSGQGRGPPNRTGRGRLRAGAPAGRQRRRGRGTPHRCRTLRCWSAIWSAPTRQFDVAAARKLLAEQLPAALVPRLVQVDELPTRTSGKVDRDALPWPPPGGPERGAARPRRARRAGWPGCGGICSAATVDGPEADFFALGGGSLSRRATRRRRCGSGIRRSPSPTCTTIPRLGSLAGFLDELEPPPQVTERMVRPTPRLAQARADLAFGAAGDAGGAALGDLAGAGQQCRPARCIWCRGPWR